MDKRGLFGKIFLIIWILIILIVLTIGITIYQGYRVYKVASNEKDKIIADSVILKEDIKKGNCSKLNDIETSINNIKSEINGACKNPIISMSIKKVMSTRPVMLPSGPTTINCQNIEPIYSNYVEFTKPLKEICNNATLMNQLQTKA